MTKCHFKILLPSGKLQCLRSKEKLHCLHLKFDRLFNRMEQLDKFQKKAILQPCRQGDYRELSLSLTGISAPFVELLSDFLMLKFFSPKKLTKKINFTVNFYKKPQKQQRTPKNFHINLCFVRFCGGFFLSVF